MKVVLKMLALLAIVLFVVGCPDPNIKVPELVTYTVTFDANGGSVNPSSISVVDGKMIADIPVPLREGYTFLGWFTDKIDYTTEFTEETPVIDDIEIFAKWELYIHQINYYVTVSGDNKNDGLTEATAFATIQHAVDIAKAHNNTNDSKSQYIINISGILEDDETDAQSSSMISISDTKALHITLKGISQYKSGTINAQGHKRVLHVAGNNTTVVIDDYITLTGGSAEKGGGVWVEAGRLTLQGGAVIGNTATLAGGGVFVDVGATLNLKDDPTISSNTVNTVNNNIEYVYSSEENRGNIFITGSLTGKSDSIGITSGSTNSKAVVIEGVSNLSKDEIKKVLISDKQTAFFIDNNTIKETFITYIIEGEEPLYGPYPTAQEAISAMRNSSTSGKSYVLRIDGIAEEGSSYDNAVVSVSSIPTLTIQGLSKDLPGIIKADGTKRALYYDGRNNSLILGENLTITGGNASEGGGVFTYGRNFTLTIDGCNIIDNSSEKGGGIYLSSQSNWSGTVVLNKGKIENNIASDVGGGIFLDETVKLSITGGSITNNTAGNNAGGVFIDTDRTLYLSGDPIIKNNTVDGSDSNLAYSFSSAGRGNIVVDAPLTGNEGDIGIVSHNILYGTEIIPASDYLTEQAYKVFKSDKPEMDFSLQEKSLVAIGEQPSFSIMYSKEGDSTHEGPFNSVQDAINNIINKNDGSHYTLTIGGLAVNESATPSSTALCVINTSDSLTLTIKGDSKQNPGIIDATGKEKTVLYVNALNANIFLGENLTIAGGNYGVSVNAGNITMLEGSQITDIHYVDYYEGSAVTLSGSGKFTMDGGSIFNNYPASQSGVIKVSASSSSRNNPQFVLNGGTIFGNTLLDQSGVIRVTASGDSNNIVTMNGGTIEDNGTSVDIIAYDNSNNIVTMNGGTIEHNGTGVDITAYDDSKNIFVMKEGTIKADTYEDTYGIRYQSYEDSSNIVSIENGNILNHNTGIIGSVSTVLGGTPIGLVSVKGGNLTGNKTGIRVDTLLLSGNPVLDNDTDIEVARDAEVYITGNLSDISDSIIINDYYDDERTNFATGTIPMAIYDRIIPSNKPASNTYTITLSDAEKFVHKEGKVLELSSNSIVIQ